MQFFYKKYKKIRLLLKHNKTLFTWYRHLTDRDYQREKKRMMECKVKSANKIAQEMETYQKYWGCPPDDYIRYGLFEKNLSIDEILDYVPMQYYYCDFMDDVTKGLDTWKVDDKWNEYKLFQEKGIPQPEVFALIKHGSLFTTEEIPLEWERFVELMNEGEKVFIKPVGGNCGNGIIVVSKQFGKLVHKNKIVNNLSQIPLSQNLVYIVQRGLVQRSDFAEINSSSLNTLRTIVKYENGKSIIVAMLLRIGRMGADVDNSGQGGVSVEVNLKDGSLGEFAGREHGGNIFPKHPDTGFVFKGAKLKDWDNVFKQAQDIVSRITDYKTIGWDIAVCEDKVYAIEMNLGWGIEYAQTIAGGFRRRMGIYPSKK